MRLDKFLKVSRIMKRRTTSKQLADNERILLNGKVAKAASKVQTGDEIALSFGERTMKFRVLEISDHSKKEEAVNMYEVIED